MAVRSLWAFFFFQAEDGIRDRNVTGVQTCALPISRPTSFWTCAGLSFMPRFAWRPCTGRSEERRVGKECRSRGSGYQGSRKRREGRAAGAKRGVEGYSAAEVQEVHCRSGTSSDEVG